MKGKTILRFGKLNMATMLVLVALTVLPLSTTWAQEPPPPEPQETEEQAILEAVREAAREGLIFTPEVADRLAIKIEEKTPDYAEVLAWQTDVNSGGADLSLKKVDDKWQVVLPDLEAQGITAQAVSGYRLPFPGGMWVRVSQNYHSGHLAYDFSPPARGKPVVAAKSGTVKAAVFGNGDGGCDESYEGLANYVVIEHAPGEYSFYGHLLRESAPVYENQYVVQGDLIGHVGNSGKSCSLGGGDGSHLHFQVQENKEYFGYGGAKYIVNFAEDSNPPYNWYNPSQNYGLVMVGRNANFEGSVEFFHHNNWPDDLANRNWPSTSVSMNDSISSIKVPPAYVAFLHSDHYRMGARKTFWDVNGEVINNFDGLQYDTSGLSLNDTVSSILIVPRYQCSGGCSQGSPPGSGGGPEPSDPTPYPGSGAWDTKYWTNKFWAGAPSWTGTTTWSGGYPYVFYEWWQNPPVSGWDPDNWSSRFERDVYFPVGYYIFRCQSDDGCVLVVDSTTLINNPNTGGDTSAQITLGSGYHHVRVDHEDNGGDAHLKLMWWGPGYVQWDNELPDGRITFPTGKHGFNTSLYMSGDAWDNQTWVDHVTWYLWFRNADGVADWWSLRRDESEPYEMVWQDDGVADQTMWIRMDVIDANGNVYVMPSDRWAMTTKDTVIPWGNFASPGQGETIKVGDNNILPIEVYAGDTGMGVAEVQFLAGYWNSDHTSWDWHNLGVDQDGSDGWRYNWNVSSFPDGTNFALFVWIRDWAGNVGSATIGDVILERLTVDEYVEVAAVSTQVSGTYQDVFNPGESFSLWIGATNWADQPVDTLWTWEVTNPDGSHNGYLSWDDFSVSMSPAANAWALNRTVPSTPGMYTFKGIVVWDDGAYRSEKTMTFEVLDPTGSESVQIERVWTSRGSTCSSLNPEVKTFTAGEVATLNIKASNFKASPLATKWTWEVEYPGGSIHPIHQDFPVTMNPSSTALWCSDQYTMPSGNGNYTFTGRITWGDTDQHGVEASVPFTITGGVDSGGRIYLPLIVK